MEQIMRQLFFATMLAASTFTSATTFAQSPQFGTAAEAKAMLDKAVAAMTADKAKALEMFSKGEGGFKDRDLYVACGGPDGKVTAHINPARIGLDIKEFKDSTGKLFGAELLNVSEGKVTEVSYLFPRPGADTTPVQKVSYATKIGDTMCMVGFYK
jgi:signal transduction histidine kinase